jgi:hypothetical protein
MPTAPGKYKPFGRLTINGQEYGAFVGVDDIYIAGVTFNPNVSWS